MRLFKWLYNLFDKYFSQDDIKIIKEKDNIISKLSDRISNLDGEVEELTEKNEVLINKLLTFKKDEENKSLEEYWNNKRPKKDTTYCARDGIYVDPRIFFQHDDTLQKANGALTYDQRVIKCLDWVHDNITYINDKGEQWLFAYETNNIKDGDCEDGAILMANMMLMSGIPYWRIRLNAGDVKGGGHCWVTYLAKKDNQWYILDWCYWYDESKGLKKLYKDAEKYFKIWFSWNTKYLYLDETYERENS